MRGKKRWEESYMAARIPQRKETVEATIPMIYLVSKCQSITAGSGNGGLRTPNS
jgi:hypothetical protein